MHAFALPRRGQGRAHSHCRDLLEVQATMEMISNKIYQLYIVIVIVKVIVIVIVQATIKIYLIVIVIYKKYIPTDGVTNAWL